ncbi:MAG: hypothetical protein D6758_13800, partial [Gammaproteobacteria bacterium]
MFACIQFEEPALDTWLHSCPNLSNTPVVLAEPHSRRVVSACPRSQALGIRPGFSLASAQALAGNVTVLPASDSHLTQVMHTLAEHALQFSDQV